MSETAENKGKHLVAGRDQVAAAHSIPLTANESGDFYEQHAEVISEISSTVAEMDLERHIEAGERLIREGKWPAGRPKKGVEPLHNISNAERCQERDDRKLGKNKQPLREEYIPQTKAAGKEPSRKGALEFIKKRERQKSATEAPKPQPDGVILIQGDALDMETWVEPESAQCVITSPPYYKQKSYPVPDSEWDEGWQGKLGDEPTMELYIKHIVAIAEKVKRILKPDGIFWLNLGDVYARGPGNGPMAPQTVRGYSRGEPEQRERRSHLKPKDVMLIPYRVALRLQEEMGWYLRDPICWFKRNTTDSVKDRPIHAYETILMLTKQPRYFYNPEDNPRDVWEINNQFLNEPHYAHFPSELAETCIRLGSRAGDLVVDPFAGTGTVGMAASKLGRRAICIELSPEYVAMARRRISRSEELSTSDDILAAD